MNPSLPYRTAVHGLVLCMLLMADPGSGSGQTVDPTFASVLREQCTMLTVQAQASVVLFDDGYTLIGPVLVQTDAGTRYSIARVTQAGDLIPIYTQGVLPDGRLETIVRLLPHGPEHVVAVVARAGSNTRYRLLRLRRDGAIDTSFERDSLTTGELQAAAVDSNGRIVLAGRFRTSDGYVGVIRCRFNGRIDPSFSQPTIGRNTITCLSVAPSGKITIGGSFDALRGSGRRSIARLKEDGMIDETFAPVISDTETVSAVEIVGDETFIATLTKSRGVRLTRLDDSGRPTSTCATVDLRGMLVHDIRVLGSGVIVASGLRHRTETEATAGVISLVGCNGSLDHTVYGRYQANGPIASMAEDDAGRILMIGSFSYVGGHRRNGFARLAHDGSIDTTFRRDCGLGSALRDVIRLPNGGLLISGDHLNIGEIPTGPISSIDATGTPTLQYRDTLEPYHVVGSLGADELHVDPEGRVIFRNRRRSTQEDIRGTIRRVLDSGKADRTVRFDPLLMDSIRTLCVLSDGRIAIAGPFTIVDGQQRNGIALLRTDGSVDASFDPGDGIAWASEFPVHGMDATADNGLLVYGSDFSFNGSRTLSIHKLTSTGTLDTTFRVDPRVSGVVGWSTIHDVAHVPDGRLYVLVETLISTTGFKVHRLARDGSIDASFIRSELTGGTAICLDRFHRVYVAQSTGVVRLSSNGTTEVGKVATTDGPVAAMTVTDDDALVIVGAFGHVNDVEHPYIAKIRLDLPTVVEGSTTFSDPLTIAPNPAQSRAVLSLPPDQGAVLVTVTDMCGREVLRQQVVGEMLEMATDGWAPGLYSVRALGRTTMSAPMMVTR